MEDARNAGMMAALAGMSITQNAFPLLPNVLYCATPHYFWREGWKSVSIPVQRPTQPKPETLDAVARQHIEAVLTQQDGDVPAAASVLGIPKSTLYAKLKLYGLSERRAA